MVRIRYLDARLLDDVLVIVEAHAGLHDSQGVQLIVYCPLLDDGGQILALLLLGQVRQGLDDAVGRIGRDVWPVHSEHVRQSPRHDGGVDFVRVASPAVVPGHELDIREILPVVGLVEGVHRLLVGLSLLRVLDGVDPYGEVFLPLIVACHLPRLRVFLLTAGEAGRRQDRSGQAQPPFLHHISSFIKLFLRVTVLVTG